MYVTDVMVGCPSIFDTYYDSTSWTSYCDVGPLHYNFVLLLDIRKLRMQMFGVAVVLLVPLAFTVGQIVSVEKDYCYANDDNPYLNFGRRSSYPVYRGGKTNFQKIPNCEPVQIWMLIRHGTRYPGNRIMAEMNLLNDLRNEIIENHETKGNVRLCGADLDNLKKWRLNPDLIPEIAGELTKQGIVDMKELGKRIKSHLPGLFLPVMNNVSSTNYKFRISGKERMISSETAFMAGLLNRTDVPTEELQVDDILFHTYKDCPRWTTEVGGNEEHLIEVRRFTNGPEFQKLILNISQRLGFEKNLTFQAIKNVWNMCRYDTAWEVDKLSPWCAVFSKEELMVLEYVEDLEDYYKRGYGHEMNSRLGCPPLRDLFQHFEKLESADYSKEPKGIFNIARSGSVHLFMAAFGLAMDPAPPLATDFHRMSEHRWRTSEIGTFATNIAVVFYKCNDSKSPNKVMTYLSEKPAYVQGCNAGLCDWDYLRDKYRYAASHCNVDFCNLDDTLSLSAPFIALLFILFLPILSLSYRRLLKANLSSMIWMQQRFWKRFKSHSTLQIA